MNVIKPKINSALLILSLLALISFFLPWTNHNSQMIIIVGTDATKATFFFVAVYTYFLWKKKTSPRVVFILFPWLIFVGWSQSLYGISAKDMTVASLLFFPLNLTILILSIFRTKKVTADGSMMI